MRKQCFRILGQVNQLIDRLLSIIFCVQNNWKINLKKKLFGIFKKEKQLFMAMFIFMTFPYTVFEF